jgi:hypothetical protein
VPSNFQAIHLPALPHPLIESELFGHKKAAFTDACTDKLGLLAGDGIDDLSRVNDLLLDEIGDISAALQPNLLGALDTPHCRPLGGALDEEDALNARILMATNRSLQSATSSRTDPQQLSYEIPAPQARGIERSLIVFRLRPVTVASQHYNGYPAVVKQAPVTINGFVHRSLLTSVRRWGRSYPSQPPDSVLPASIELAHASSPCAWHSWGIQRMRACEQRSLAVEDMVVRWMQTAIDAGIMPAWLSRSQFEMSPRRSGTSLPREQRCRASPCRNICGPN